MTLSHNIQYTTTETLELLKYSPFCVVSYIFQKGHTIYVHEFLIQFLFHCVSVGNFYNFNNVD